MARGLWLATTKAGTIFTGQNFDKTYLLQADTKSSYIESFSGTSARTQLNILTKVAHLALLPAVTLHSSTGRSPALATVRRPISSSRGQG